MRRFLNQNNAAFSDLEQRAQNACIRFQHVELPSGCTPAQADLGFEVDSNTGSAKLLVSRGVQYQGADASIAGWFSAGMIELPSFAEMVSWLQGPIAAAFDQTDESPAPSELTPREASSGAITDMASVEAGIPDPNKPLYLDENALAAKLKASVLGQDDAIDALSAIMVRHLARKEPSRPAVAFAVGPTGIGKTRSAEVLAKRLREFDDQCTGYQYLRLDMSEYQEAHRVSQLLGAPQGYLGHGDGSQLIDALRANPRTIVLFDEIEKAHPAILRTLMNAMDAGRISSASGAKGSHEIDCRYAVFMFTSNLDAKAILDELDSRNAFGNRSVEDEVCRRRLNAAGLAPEIIGRISRFLVYRPLEPKTRAEIITLAIAEVAKEYGIDVGYVKPNVIIEIMKQVRSTGFGIRPEKYLIDDLLGPALAEAAKSGMKEPACISGPPYQCRQQAVEEDDQKPSGES
ncbi:Chaperone protein ClpB [Pontiella desulfatans]|uniref:Chaperone protein ClpB n=1 Tax=Pontiella desulfatans TaxID=2750659 RepID=A0A6C2U5G5_PONDE|nr:AAA family ATPase [Pontiella desulfatans]VGO15047.1 Chaperone protein ClpB [Pontiella desulfatans]